MRDIFLRTIQLNNLVERGDGIVLGVSGGPDSMCMLHLFCSIREEWDLSLYAVHLNHEFRGTDADADALYVKEMCEAWQVPLYSFSSNVEALAKEWKTSFEDAGRRERYRLFFKVMADQKAEKIAVAQNKNDQAETVLMRLIRGSGLDGLSGIDYYRADGVIRPVLDISRADIEAYCQNHQLMARIDHTNEDEKYTRNRIRKSLLSEMKAVNPMVIDHIVQTSQLLKAENELLNDLTLETVERISQKDQNGLVVELNAFNKLNIALKRRVLRHCIQEIRGHLTDVTFDEIETVIELAKLKKTGNRKNYHENLTFEISYDKLMIHLGKQNNKNFTYKLEVREMTREEYADYKLLADEIAIDKMKIAGELVIKTRTAGDRFFPMGLGGSKKVKDFFIDKKIPRDERDSIPIIWDEKGIVWIVGYRQDGRYVVDDNTSKILILQCMKLLTK